MPQLLSGSVVVGNSGTGLFSVKLQPSVASTVVVVDLLIGRAGLLGVFLVELADDVWSVFKVSGWIPATIGVVEASSLDSILDLGSVSLGIEDFFYFPLLLFLDDNGRGWWLVVSGYGFCTGCGFKEADVEDWVDFDCGRQVQLIGV